jgi:hypothetical protein
MEVAMNWEPIKTAPKDKYILAVCINSKPVEYAVVSWDAEDLVFLERGEYVGGFTHWMPLPEAPK